MKNLAIIPARGGSKRIPQKNIKNFLGQPIIKYSIDAALKSKCFSEVMVSTDDQEIARIARKCGAKVPFLRSKKNSNDKANLVDVRKEVILEYKKMGIEFDYFCSIMATAPFITSQRLSQGYKKIKEFKADHLITVVRFNSPIQRAFKVSGQRLKMVWSENMNKHSQKLIPTYHDAGQFDWFNMASFLKQQKTFLNYLIPFELPEYEAQDIDTPEDWRIAEIKFKILKNYEAN